LDINATVIESKSEIWRVTCLYPYKEVEICWLSWLGKLQGCT